MKLSEAIRLGAMMKPQGRSFLLHDGRTCALGAAADAVAIDLPEGPYIRLPLALFAHFPILSTYRDTHCPICREDRCGIDSMIVHLNDYHRWTRERIADWVATVEAPESASALKDAGAVETVDA